MTNTQIMTAEQAKAFVSHGAVFTFKNPRLNAISEEIAIAANELISKSNNAFDTISRALATVQRDKLYKDDGFESVAEYSEKTFGLKPSITSQYCKAGIIYMDADTINNNPVRVEELKAKQTTHPEEMTEEDKKDTATLYLSTLTPAKIAEFTKVPDTAISDGVVTRTLTENTTQKDMREFAKTHKVEKKDDSTSKVVTMYNVWYGPGRIWLDGVYPETEIISAVIKANFPNAMELVPAYDVVKLPVRETEESEGKKTRKHRYNRMVIAIGMITIAVEFEKARKEEIAAQKLIERRNADKMSVDELRAMVDEMKEAEIELDENTGLNQPESSVMTILADAKKRINSRKSKK